jgi:hypothetical protein
MSANKGHPLHSHTINGQNESYSTKDGQSIQNMKWQKKLDAVHAKSVRNVERLQQFNDNVLQNRQTPLHTSSPGKDSTIQRLEGKFNDATPVESWQDSEDRDGSRLLLCHRQPVHSFIDEAPRHREYWFAVRSSSI